MNKIFITNRHQQKLAVLFDAPAPQKGLAFVMHGLGGFKEQPHIAAVASVFKDAGFITVRFDTANTLGESDGDYEKATVTNYLHDLDDVIAWAKKQPWYQEPFVLFGSSLGGMCILLYAQQHPEKVKALVPNVTVVSGQLSLEAHKKSNPTELAEWQKTGWRKTISTSKNGTIKRLPWSHMEDRLRYDILPKTPRLTMPVLLIGGEKDTSTPIDHIEILFKALPGKKEFHIIKDAPHTFIEPRHLTELRNVLAKWLKTIEK